MPYLATLWPWWCLERLVPRFQDSPTFRGSELGASAPCSSRRLVELGDGGVGVSVGILGASGLRAMPSSLRGVYLDRAQRRGNWLCPRGRRMAGAGCCAGPVSPSPPGGPALLTSPSTSPSGWPVPQLLFPVLLPLYLFGALPGLLRNGSLGSHESPTSQAGKSARIVTLWEALLVLFMEKVARSFVTRRAAASAPVAPAPPLTAEPHSAGPPWPPASCSGSLASSGRGVAGSGSFWLLFCAFSLKRKCVDPQFPEGELHAF